MTAGFIASAIGIALIWLIAKAPQEVMQIFLVAVWLLFIGGALWTLGAWVFRLLVAG